MQPATAVHKGAVHACDLVHPPQHPRPVPSHSAKKCCHAVPQVCTEPNDKLHLQQMKHPLARRGCSARQLAAHSGEQQRLPSVVCRAARDTQAQHTGRSIQTGLMVQRSAEVAGIWRHVSMQQLNAGRHTPRTTTAKSATFRCKEQPCLRSPGALSCVLMIVISQGLTRCQASRAGFPVNERNCLENSGNHKQCGQTFSVPP